jgi:hypothetical protein
VLACFLSCCLRREKSKSVSGSDRVNQHHGSTSAFELAGRGSERRGESECDGVGIIMYQIRSDQT